MQSVKVADCTNTMVGRERKIKREGEMEVNLIKIGLKTYLTVFQGNVDDRNVFKIEIRFNRLKDGASPITSVLVHQTFVIRSNNRVEVLIHTTQYGLNTIHIANHSTNVAVFIRQYLCGSTNVAVLM